jgi:hypothetical protein
MRSVVHRIAAVLSAGLLVVLAAVPSTAASVPTWSHRDVNVCGPAGASSAACASVARLLYRDGTEFLAGTPGDLGRIAKPAASVSYTAVGIRTAYGITGVGSPSQVVAIVDAYDNPNAYSHLATYRSSNSTLMPAMADCSSSLSSLTSGSSPCFAKVNQVGGTSYPSADSGWATEIDLDLQAASAVCPNCSILLVEANSASFADLGTAVTFASGVAGVRAISNSYSSSGDYPGSLAPAWDNAAKKGIAVMASTGDGGYGVGFPASGTYVLGVGGTNVQVDANGVRSAETAWSGSGSGCSTYNAAPSWQVISGSPCGTSKAIADLSADADPNSGLQVYTTYSGITGWWIFGGTSLSSPLMGALYAMQGGYNATTLASAYAWAPTTAYYDVTSGSNGSCGAPLCTARSGWDGPTGRGSIQLAAVTQTLTSIAVTPANASVQVGGTQQFTATGLDQNGSPMATQPTFTWSVSGGGTIDASTGRFSATTVGSGFTVTASGGGKTGTAQVTVTAPQTLTTIVVSPPSASVAVGGTQQFTAIAYDQSNNPMSPQPSFAWSVNGGGTIGSSGLFSATSAGGPFTVTAASGSVSGTAGVTVTVAPDFSLSATPPSQSVRRGFAVSYAITISPINGFSGGVSLSVTGAPGGAKVTITPNPATTGATLTVATRSSTSPRTYTLTILGTSGSLSHSTSVTLAVTR